MAQPENLMSPPKDECWAFVCVFMSVYMFMISGCLLVHSNDKCLLHQCMLPQSWTNVLLSRDLNRGFVMLSLVRFSLCCSVTQKRESTVFSHVTCFFSVCVCRNVIGVCDWEVCRPSASHSRSAVPLCNFHRGDEESRWRGHNPELQVCNFFDWHCERSLGRPALWTVTPGTCRGGPRGVICLDLGL